MLQLFELCRLCAQKKRTKLKLFTEENNEEAKILLAKISICLSVQVTKEDLLPKMICIDCQKSVEQFNAFRVKCHKAEERLIKMLSLVIPNRPSITEVKQEHIEADFLDNSGVIEKTESSTYMRPVKIVKSEVEEEEENEHQWGPPCNNSASNLIQLISEEMVNQQSIIDIKHPQIEIISENFNADYKNTLFNDEENEEMFDRKVIPEVLITEGAVNPKEDDMNLCDTITEPIHFVEVKEPHHESEEETAVFESPKLQKILGSQTWDNTQALMTKSEKLQLSLNSSNCESDFNEKHFTLAEEESCDIDMEEMEAIIRKNNNPNAKFHCNKCQKSFKFIKCFRKHKNWHKLQSNVFICNVCKTENGKSFEFSSLKCLNSHIQRKHFLSNSTIKCDICKKQFVAQGQLNSHIRKVHNTTEAPCQICEKVFKNKTRLNEHLRVHEENRPYVCDQCGQTFKWSSALKVHIQWHKQEKNFLCSECGKKFTAKKNLIEHLNTHTGKRPFVCEICRASFAQFSAYSKHLHLHNPKSKIHKCPQCDKSFSHSFMLKQHLLLHSNVRPYECSVCHSTFKSQSNLWCHSKTHQDKQYGCQVCGKKFSLLKTLKDHMVLHTGIKHVCPVPNCGKSYTQRFSLTKHFSKQHPAFNIIRKKGGRKIHTWDKAGTNTFSSDMITYHFREKNEGVLIC